MLLNPNIVCPQTDSLFAGNSGSASLGKAEEALQSHMIIGFEEALGLGMSPLEALSQVLCWVASEMHRIKTAESPEEGGGLSPYEGKKR